MKSASQRSGVFGVGVFVAALSACAGTTAPPATPAAAAASTPATSAVHVRLYALDCGRAELNDFGFFSASGKPTGEKRTLADPCFLIVHPKGTLLWDTGLPEATAQAKDGGSNPVGKMYVDVQLRDQLQVLHLAPSDITFVGFSHLHADHAGNANLFTTSTWLLNRKELEAALRTPTPMGVEAATFSSYATAHKKLLEADEDVFGDGRVVILQTPGHTPGHQSLEVRLDQAGTIILTGDLAHSRGNWNGRVVPSFNDSRENTLASFDKVQAIVAQTHARVVVQHDADDFHALPKFPAYLE